jgi:hypothetical protein
MTKLIAVNARRFPEQTGQRCKRKAIPGGTVCRWHGGAASQVKVKAAIRAEVMNWGLGDSYVAPGEVLLRLVTQSAAPAERYARLRLAPPKLAPAIIGAWLTDSGRESQV